MHKLIEDAVNGPEAQNMHAVAVNEILRRTNKRLAEVLRVTRIFSRSKRQFERGKISLTQMCKLNLKAMDKYGIGR